MKKVSIRWILILGMPGLIIGMITLITLSTYFSSKQVFTHHARDIMRNISSYTIDKSRSHLNPARDAALLTSGLAVSKIVTSSNKEEMESYFYEQLLVNSQISNIYYGTVEGEFVMVSRKEGGRFLTKIVSAPDEKRQVLFKEMDSSFSELYRYSDSNDTYDPRQRPWFKKAVSEEGLIWTDPYVFFTSRNPGITTASPVYNVNGSLHGVVGVDIEISELSDFIKTLTIGENGKAFILDSSGQVLAYPEKDKITHSAGESDTVSLVSIGELDDPVSQAAYNALQTIEYDLNDNREIFFSFKHEGEVYQAMFAPFRASYWPWLLGIYVAEDDYIGVLKSNRNYIIMISALLAFSSILIGFFITRSIVSALNTLQKAAKQVGDGNLDEALVVNTPYRELDETAGIFDIMRIDLKEKSKIEEQFQQTQKVESIGRLAGGVAHDLNNLLTPILGYSEILMSKLSDDAKVTRQVGQIHKAGVKAKELVQQLLAFSRKQDLEYKTMNLNDVVSDFQKLLRRTIREDIDLVINLSEKPSLILADRGQIEQVIMNLAVNGQDAMDNRGTLTIDISLVDREERKGTDVLLAVRDGGCGMDDETQKHIFEPFFSTKGDLGIGLGLATVHGIVNQHHGEIVVKSRVGEGTAFEVYLPLVGDGIGEVPKSLVTEEKKEGTGTILVAEDNLQVLELTETILESLGYNVLTAENGLKALDILREQKDPVDLLLSDVVMPELNGKELYERARLIHGELKVLFMSGYTDNVIARHNVKGKDSPFIQKPFTKADLAGKLREILETDQD
ncbi:MAG: cache domain-containing protein [Spirochaetales bacterium]|nr:cache domain-containing protein [Spirochaetales bacterium]